MKPKIILTFDLEEFDLPLEFGCNITEKEQLDVANEGLQRLIKLLNANNIKATFFVTGFFCEKNQAIIKALSEKHEIASHAYYHSRFDEEFIQKSKQMLESIIGKPIKGYRMPLLQKIDFDKLKQAGYEYDSSINPTYIPGRYNHFRASKTPYTIHNNGLLEVPLSVSPLIRFPLFWLSFKNLPLFIYKRLCFWTLKKEKYIHLYFHPWEFAQIGTYKIPGYIKNISGEAYTKKFGELLEFLNINGEFVTVSEFIESRRL